jgi:hypothetical protein
MITIFNQQISNTGWGSMPLTHPVHPRQALLEYGLRDYMIYEHTSEKNHEKKH